MKKEVNFKKNLLGFIFVVSCLGIGIHSQPSEEPVNIAPIRDGNTGSNIQPNPMLTSTNSPAAAQANNASPSQPNPTLDSSLPSIPENTQNSQPNPDLDPNNLSATPNVENGLPPDQPNPILDPNSTTPNMQNSLPPNQPNPIMRGVVLPVNSDTDSPIPETQPNPVLQTANSSSIQPSPCDSNCIVCENNICSSCAIRYSLNPTTKQCNQCPVNCALCSNEYDCEVCDQGFELDETMAWCVLSSAQCPLGCQECTSDGVCSRCQTGYFFEMDRCQECIANCDVCLDATSCFTCSENFLIQPDDTCVSAEQPLNCMQNCKTCANNSSCNQCNDGYFFDNTTNICSACEQGCQVCADKTICFTCLNGFSPTFGGNCHNMTGVVSGPNIFNRNCTENCLRCDGNNQACLTCEAMYNLTDDGKCLSNNMPCPTANCIECQNETCSYCDDGFFLDSTSECLSCQPSCSACTSDFTCISCEDGFYLDDDTEACLSCGFNCSTCYDHPDVCTSCPGSLTVIEGQCLNVSRVCPIPGCIACDSFNTSRCYDCDPNHHLNFTTFGCSPCPNNCLGCNTNGTCLQCLDGFTLVNNVCLVLTNDQAASLSSCPDGEFFTPDGCESCGFECIRCGDILTCLECTDGYVADRGHCVLPSEQTQLSTGASNLTLGQPILECLNCLNCDQNGACLECLEGYFLNEGGLCELLCPDGSRPVNGNCDLSINSCDSNCRICNPNNICSVCNPGFFMDENFHCSACSSDCSTCNSNTTCQECNANFKLANDGRCYSIPCPQNCRNNAFGLCTKCPQNCTLCSGPQTCTTCQMGWMLTDPLLLTPFGLDDHEYQESIGYNANSPILICIGCLSNCLDCTGLFSCQRCAEGYDLFISGKAKICSKTMGNRHSFLSPLYDSPLQI